MFSALPKIADRNFVVGFLLPTLIAAFTFLYLFNDVEPFRSAYAAALNIKTFGDVAIAALLIWTGSIVLAISNTWQYRVLEGYVGPFNRESLRERSKSRLSKEQRHVSTLERAARSAHATTQQTSAYLNALRHVLQNYPLQPDLVLPTRFGNTVRAFETYPGNVYRADAIPVWLRLQSVIPKHFAGLISDARANVDFFVNAIYLAVGLSALGFLRLIWFGYSAFQSKVPLEPGCLKYPAFFVLAAICVPIAYRAAIATAEAWGDLVKSAFDLYLPALANQLGYQQPSSAAERRRFWDEMTSMFLYQKEVLAENWLTETDQPPHAEVSAHAAAPDARAKKTQTYESGSEDESASAS